MNVLLIDDEAQYCENLRKFALVRYNANLTYFHNYEEGFADLLQNTAYQAIILDAKCLINKEQEVERDDALDYALKRLSDFEKQTQRFLPFVVNTGYDYFTSFFATGLQERKSKIFLKSEPPEKLFDYLQHAIAHSDTYRIERKYADVFEVFEKTEYATIKNDALAYLKDFENDTVTRDTLVSIRKVFETLRNDFPASQPDNIHPLTGCIWKMTSHYLHKKAPLPSSYLIKSLGYALLDVLLWFKAEMK
jgi:hypothetical protein